MMITRKQSGTVAAGVALSLALVFPSATLAQGEAADELLSLVRQGETAQALVSVAELADVNAASSDGTTLLHWATYYNDADLVRALIERGADATARNEFNATPLAQAALNGNADILQRLLQAGADANEKGADDQTPLMIVARTGRIEAAQVLIDAGADVNAVESWRGQTALMWAAAQKQADMVKLLLDHGADPNAQSNRTGFERQVTAEPRVKVLPDGALTAMLYAAREGCADCIEHLIDAGADTELADPNEVTPLILATFNGHWDTAKVLIERGANVNKWDWWGRTPLYGAVDMNTTPRGGRPDLPSMDKTSGLEVIALLLENGANPNLQLKLFPPYRALGADRGADGILTVGATALHRAARAADIEAMELLLAYEANVDLPTMAGITPLMAAAGLRASSIDTRGRLRTESQALEASRVLLEHGAKVDSQENFGQTALHGAASQGYAQVIELLAGHGANLRIEDQNGNTALDVAMGRGGAFGRGTGGGTVHAEAGAVLQKLMGESGE